MHALRQASARLRGDTGHRVRGDTGDQFRGDTGDRLCGDTGDRRRGDAGDRLRGDAGLCLRNAARLSLVLGLLVVAAPSSAQRVSPGGTSRLDFGGNAMAHTPNRMVSGIRSQQTLARFQQYQGRPRDYLLSPRRGWGTPLAGASILPDTGHWLDFDPRRGGALSSGVSAGGVVGSGGLSWDLVLPMPQSYSYYGGYGTRVGWDKPKSIDFLLRQRPSLLAATKHYAPLERARMRTGGSLASSAVIRETPTRLDQPAGAEASRDGTREALAPDAPVAVDVQLVDQIVARLATRHVRARNEAWERFRAGQYRRAIRLFEACLTLDRDDREAVFGQLMCSVATEAYGSARLLMAQLAAMNPNPFDLPVKLISGNGPDDVRMLSSPNEARQIRTLLAAQQTTDQETSAAQAALSSLVLWYMEDRVLARSIALQMVSEHPNTKYAAWPRLMGSGGGGLTPVP